MKYKYTRIEYNISTSGNYTEISPIAFEVDENSEDTAFLEMARNNYPNPAIILEDCEGYSPKAKCEVIYDMMIVAIKI